MHVLSNSMCFYEAQLNQKQDLYMREYWLVNIWSRFRRICLTLSMKFACFSVMSFKHTSTNLAE